MRPRDLSTAPGAPLELAVVLALAAGLLLAGLAVVVDEVQLPGGRLLLVIFSTGLSWGAAASAVGALARARIAAAVGGFVVLAAAVSGYYFINYHLGLRDTSGAALFDAGLIWGAAALVGGPILGLLGWHARFGEERGRAVAYGVLAGLLLGQGLRWAVRYGLSPDPVLTTALVIPLVIFFAGARGRAIGWGLLTLGVSALASAGVWALLETIS